MPSDAVTTFEDRLLDQLLSELPPPRPARRARWWTVGAVTAAVAALLAGLTVGPPAYAVDEGADGSLTVTMHSIVAADVADAEAELKERGARIELVATTHDCLGVLGAPLVVPSHPPLSGPPSRDQRPELFAFQAKGDGRFVVRPDVIPAGQVLWVALADNGTTLATVAGFATEGAPQPNLCR